MPARRRRSERPRVESEALLAHRSEVGISRDPTVHSEISRTSPLPYYLQLLEILSDAINRNVWPVGELIPSEAELATTYGISRTVIRKALDRLVAVGRVQRLKGKGTVVVDPPQFNEEITAAARRWAEGLVKLAVGQILDSRRVAVGTVGNLLGLKAEDEVFRLTCLKTEANRPVALTQLSLRADAAPAVQRVAQANGVLELDGNGAALRHQLVTRYGVRTSRSEAWIEPVICSEFEARALGIQPHQPVLCLSLVYNNQDGTPILFIRITCSPAWSRMSSS